MNRVVDFINYDMTPEEANKDGHIYDVNGDILVEHPSFILIPKKDRKVISKVVGHYITKINVLRVERTDKKCPYGAGLKMYILEHDMICLCTKGGFIWLSTK